MVLSTFPDFLNFFFFLSASVLKALELILDGLRSKKVTTKRDLFYRSVKVFGKQARVDSVGTYFCLLYLSTAN